MDASRYALASWSAVRPAHFFVQYYVNLEQTRFRLTGTAGATAIAIGYFLFLLPSSLPRLGFGSERANQGLLSVYPCQPLAEPNGGEGRRACQA